MTTTTLLDQKASHDILDAVSLLHFSTNQAPGYAELAGAFLAHVRERLAHLLHLAGPDTPAGQAFAQKAACLSASQFDAFCLQPEVLNRVLNFQRFDHQLPRVLADLNRFADAALAQATHTYDTSAYPYLWSAAGDYFIKYDAATASFREFNALRLSTGVPLDFFSVNLLAIRNEDVTGELGGEVIPYDFSDAERIADLIQGAINPLHTVPNGALALLGHFASVILVKRVLHSEYFISGTHGNYINRIVLANPDLAGPSQLIDGLVHECIHGLLFMVNECEQWLPDVEEAESYGPQFTSYWTGRDLALRSFLEAHFVWYGLFRFWEFARQHGLYHPGYAQKRLDFIRAGFAKSDIGAVNARLRTKLTDKLLAAIEQMRATLAAT